MLPDKRNAGPVEHAVWQEMADTLRSPKEAGVIKILLTHGLLINKGKSLNSLAFREQDVQKRETIGFIEHAYFIARIFLSESLEKLCGMDDRDLRGVFQQADNPLLIYIP